MQGAAQFLCQLSKGVSGVVGDILGSQVGGVEGREERGRRGKGEAGKGQGEAAGEVGGGGL